MTDNNITIESLFGKEKSLAFWQLREIALNAGMTNEALLVALNEAIKSGDVEVDQTTGVITIMSGSV